MITLEHDPSGRARCCICHYKIAKGELRVRSEAYRSGSKAHLKCVIDKFEGKPIKYNPN